MKKKLLGVVVSSVVVGLATVTLFVFYSASNPAYSAPAAQWTPDSVNAVVVRNGRTEVRVNLNAVEALGNVDLGIVPEISPYVDVTPSTLNNVKSGDSISIRIGFHASATAPLGLFDGTIQVRQRTSKGGQGKVLARPLPVHVLIREEEGLSSVDADGNGVWDYIDQYINTTYPNSAGTRAALRQFARAIEGGLLHAEDKGLSLQFASAIDRATECAFSIHQKDADRILSDLEAVILNTSTRSRAFFMFSEQSAGQVFPAASLAQLGSSCISE